MSKYIPVIKRLKPGMIIEFYQGCRMGKWRRPKSGIFRDYRDIRPGTIGKIMSIITLTDGRLAFRIRIDEIVGGVEGVYDYRLEEPFAPRRLGIKPSGPQDETIRKVHEVIRKNLDSFDCLS